MHANQIFRLSLDSAMLLFFLLLMADRYTGNPVHEIAGLLLFFLFAVHTAVNDKWYATIMRGSYPPTRTLRLAVNGLLLAAFMGSVGSGILISKTVFPFAGFADGFSMRTLHMCLAHWTFLLAGVHLGLYWQRIWNGIRTHFPLWAEKVKSGFLPTALVSLMALYGIYAFSVRDMRYVLTMQSAYSVWIDGDTALGLLFDYGSMLCLFAVLANIAVRVVNHRKERDSSMSGNRGYSLKYVMATLAAVAIIVLFTIQARAEGEKEKSIMTNITVTVGNASFPGVLYDNAAAKALFSRLPVHFSLSRGSRDYCGNMGTPLPHEEKDIQNGYRNGDLVWWLPGNDFVIFTEREESSSEVEGCVILGRLLSGVEEIRNMGRSSEVSVTAR